MSIIVDDELRLVKLILDIAAELFNAKKENKKLKDFAKEIFESHPDGSLDGGDIQDIAVNHGLLIETTVYAPCQPEGCRCSEYYLSGDFKKGISCFRLASFLKDKETSE